MLPRIYLNSITVCILLFASPLIGSAQQARNELQQITLLLQEKQSRTATERKIESSLLQAMRESKGMKMAAGVDLAPANVNADGQGFLDVDIDGSITAELLRRIRSIGGTIIFPSERYHTVRARINLSMVVAVAGYEEVSFIKPAVMGATVSQSKSKPGMASFFDLPLFMPPAELKAAIVSRKLKQFIDKKEISSPMFFSGSVTSEGNRTHRADDAKTTYGYEGQGIRIGVLSDTYNTLNAAGTDVSLGDLPGAGNPESNAVPVTVLQDNNSGSDEGRAMLQIVHDIAPRAQLFYAAALISEAGFASNIIALRNPPYNCDIIIDDIFYYDEPVFQDGILADAVNTVTASGALYFSSAGNEGSVLKNTAGYYEADFNDVGSLVFNFPGGTKAGTIHNFGTAVTPIDGDIITQSGNRYTLHWADPWAASSNDYDLFLVSSTGTVKGSSTNIQSGGQNPYETISVQTLVAGDRLIVFKTAAAQPLAFAINTFRGKLTKFTNGQVHGHNTAVDAYSVAATPAVGPYPSAFNNTNQVESFSSDGPRRMFFNANGSAITPGNFLIATNGGNIRNKPDITAADGVTTTLGASSGLNPFFGTSAAAPHAGAIAALIKSANPSITAAQMRTLLTSTALDIQGAGWDINSGYGIVQAFQAMQLLNPTAATADVAPLSYTITEGPGSNANGTTDPGEIGNLVIQLNNPFAAAATNVNATITTSTAGVTITQDDAFYGTIAAGSSANNIAFPFVFSVNSSVACGTIIYFSMNVTFTGGVSPQVFLLTARVGSVTPTISSSLGSSPGPGPTYTTFTGTQTGRLNRFAPPSECSTSKSNPGLFTASGSRQYTAYTFTNTSLSSQCVTVSLVNSSGTGVFCVAYDNNGFNAASPSSNYLADAASSNTHVQFSFNAPAGQSFTVVVHDVSVLPTSGASYNLDVSLSACDVVIPVKWLDFTATLKNRQSYLEWKVTNEINVSHYEVEYSVDDISFEKLYSVAVSTASAFDKTYNKIHPLPLPGNNYYRIKQVDYDGRSSYSKTINVKLEKGNFVSVNPNPASDHVTVLSGYPISLLQLYNATGQLVKTEKPLSGKYDLNISSLPAGTYSLRIETNKEWITKKIIKQ